MIGQRFGRLIVSNDAPRSKWGMKRWECLCDCGTIKSYDQVSLKSGKTKSCGCFRKDFLSKIASTHHLSKTPAYRLWLGIKQRCQDANIPRWMDYGGRGITVCERWQTFELFIKDMGEKPFPRAQIDRKRNDEGYNPDNCHWTTAKQNSRNKRNNVLLTYLGETCTVAEWAERVNIQYGTLHIRLKKGWSVERALTQPLRISVDGVYRLKNRDNAPVSIK